MHSVIGTALGEIPADLYISGGRLLNVFSGEIIDGFGVAVKDGVIAYVGPSRSAIGSGTRVIEANGAYLVPGYIDAHGHADVAYNPVSLAEAVVPLGTTVIYTDVHDFTMALGTPGAYALMSAARKLPCKYYFSALGADPPAPGAEEPRSLTLAELEQLLDLNDVLGIGETAFWTRIVSREPEIMARLNAALSRGKRVEGHAAGCSDMKLNAVVAAGFTSCHESISEADAVERLRAGLYVMIRGSSIRNDLDVLKFLSSYPEADKSRVIIVSDWISPKDIHESGYMDCVIKEAIEVGVPVIDAYRMATINPARYLGIDRTHGAIAPGRRADILLLNDLLEPRPFKVICNGKLVTEDRQIRGQSSVRVEPVPISRWPARRVPINRVSASDFVLEAPLKNGQVSVNAMALANGTITRKATVQLPVKNGKVEIGDCEDLLKLAVMRYDRKTFVVSFLEGFGAKFGGLGTTVCHDTHQPLAIGRNDEDMALALNRALEINGGIVIAHNGQIVFEFGLPLGGIASDQPMEILAGQYSKFISVLKSFGCRFDDPFFTIGFLTFTGLPYVKITPNGLYDVVRRELVETLVRNA